MSRVSPDLPARVGLCQVRNGTIKYVSCQHICNMDKCNNSTIVLIISDMMCGLLDALQAEA